MKNKKVKDFCFVENEKLWKAAILRLCDVIKPNKILHAIILILFAFLLIFLLKMIDF